MIESEEGSVSGEDSLLLRVTEWLGRSSRATVNVACAVFLVAVALVQYISGTRTTAAPLYLIPIVAVTLRSGRGTGLMYAAAGGLVFILLELPYPLNRYIWLELWNDILRVSLFVACAVAIARLKEDIIREMNLKAHLQDALAGVRQLSGLLPICAWCKRIRKKDGSWEVVEVYLKDHSRADFSQGLCPECAREHDGAPPRVTP